MNYYHLVTFEDENPRAKITNVTTFKRRMDVPTTAKNQKVIMGSKPQLQSQDINMGTYTITLGCQVAFCRNSTQALGLCRDLMNSSESEVRAIGHRMAENILKNVYGDWCYALEDGTQLRLEVKY